MRLIKIEDNVLAEDEINKVDGIKHPSFPWYSDDHTDFPGDGNPQFTHLFYQNIQFQQSNYLELLYPLFGKIKPFALLKVKANLNLATSKESVFHIDYGEVEDRVYPEMKSLVKTSIFYLDDELGGTEFESGEFVETKRNRLVTFPSGMKHRSVKHTQEGARRFVVNFNYIPFMSEQYAPSEVTI